ncbi:outer membrane beta-barrel protein [Bacteroidota bacterium]
MKKVLLTILGIFLTVVCFSQHSVKGKVISVDNKPLFAVTVVLLNPADSTMELFGVTSQIGEYEIKNIRSGKYLIQYAYVGMETLYTVVDIPVNNEGNIGNTVMKFKPVSMDEVAVVAEYIPIRIKKDTIEFNSKAFKTKPDAVVEELLKKLPGVEIDNAGNIKALGENVVKVLVDGKEFFGNDLKVATKNLPADAIDKVQVYDRKSDASEFTGIDDGVRDRTINLILQDDKRKGVFGDVLAGYGTEDHYQASGKIFRFTDKIQIAGLGMFNNINEFGFKGGNFGEKNEGWNTAGAAGLNFSYNPKQFNRYFMSYLGNGNKSILEQETYTQNFINSSSFDQENILDQTRRDTSHSITFGARARINSNHNLIVNGSINLTNTNVVRQTLMDRFMNDSPINQLINSTNEEINGINGSVSGSYAIKINEETTQIHNKFGLSLSDNFSGSTWNNTIRYFNPEEIENVNQYRDNQINRFNSSFSSGLVQRLGRLWFISPDIGLGINREELDRKQGIPGIANQSVDSLLSPNFQRNNKYFSSGVSIQRNTDKNRLNVNIRAEWSQLDKILWDNLEGQSNYFYLKPGISYQTDYRPGRRLTFRYNTGLRMPSASELLPVMNTINPLSLHQGNIDLVPEYNHSVNIDWRIFDEYSFTSFFTRLNGRYTKDKINLSRTINERLEQMLIPVNVPWNYNASAYFDFSTPLRPLGIEINATINENFNRGINVINEEDIINTNLTHSLELSINNRTKNKLDASIGASLSMTDFWYSNQDSIQKDLNNTYFNTSYFTDIRYTPSDSWNFRITANITNYNSQSFRESISIPLIGAEISYYFLTGKRAVISLTAVDLLDKNTSLRRISDVNYLMQQKTNILGRYIMFSFKYRLNKFGGSAEGNFKNNLN